MPRRSPGRLRASQFKPRRLAKKHAGNLSHCVTRKWKYETKERALADLDSHRGFAQKVPIRVYHCQVCCAYHTSSQPYTPSDHRCPTTGAWKFVNIEEAELAAAEVDRDAEDATRCRYCKGFHFDPELEPLTPTERKDT